MPAARSLWLHAAQTLTRELRDQDGRPTGGAPPGVRSFHVQRQVWIIAGAGGNVIVQVPRYPIGENPFVGEQAKQSGMPVEALMGGPETTYPEYRQRLPRTPLK